MARILSLRDFGKVTSQGSTGSMSVGRIQAFPSKNVRFGSNLDMLSLKSNNHQNLWNSLVIIVMAWFGPTFHEIRRSVGSENHRYRPPTHPHSRLCSPRAIRSRKEWRLVSWTQTMHKSYFLAFFAYLGFQVANIFTLSIDPQNSTQKSMQVFLLGVWMVFRFLK
jgi:hypothetical protein